MKNPRQFLRHRFTETGNSEQERHRQYELYKEMWRVNHPQASPREYERAMAEIARKLGV